MFVFRTWSDEWSRSRAKLAVSTIYVEGVEAVCSLEDDAARLKVFKGGRLELLNGSATIYCAALL